MPLLVREIVETARDQSPAFSRESTPDPLVRRFLTQLQQRLLSRIADLKADAVHAEHEITLPLAPADFVAGATIPSHIRVHGVLAYRTGEPEAPGVPVRLVSYTQRTQSSEMRWTGERTLYLRGDRLLLNGTPEYWTDFARLVVDYFPRGEELASQESPLVLPGQALTACAAACAQFMSLRVSDVPHAAFREQAIASEEAYIDEATGRRRAVVSRTPVAW